MLTHKQQSYKISDNSMEYGVIVVACRIEIYTTVSIEWMEEKLCNTMVTAAITYLDQFCEVIASFWCMQAIQFNSERPSCSLKLNQIHFTKAREVLARIKLNKVKIIHIVTK